MLLVVLAIAVSACKRRPGEWPSKEVEDLRAKCPETVGDPSVCDCFAKELSRRVPWERMEQWNLQIDRAHSAEVVELENALLFCAGDAGVAPYAPAMRKRTMEGCLPSATLNQCKCIVKLYEDHIPVSQLAVAGFRTKRGSDGGLDSLMAPLKEPLLKCFMDDEDAPWTESATKKLEKGCLDEGASESFCTCYVVRSKKLISYALLARASRDPEAAKSLEEKFNSAAEECLAEEEAERKAKRGQ